MTVDLGGSRSDDGTELIIRPEELLPTATSVSLAGLSSFAESFVLMLMRIAGFFPSRASFELRLASLLRFDSSDGVSVKLPGLLIAVWFMYSLLDRDMLRLRISIRSTSDVLPSIVS